MCWGLSSWSQGLSDLFGIHGGFWSSPVLFTGLQGISFASLWMLWAVGGIFHHLLGSQGPSRTMRGPQAPPGFALYTPRYPRHVWGEGLGQWKRCRETGFAQSEGLPADIP